MGKKAHNKVKTVPSSSSSSPPSRVKKAKTSVSWINVAILFAFGWTASLVLPTVYRFVLSSISSMSSTITTTTTTTTTTNSESTKVGSPAIFKDNKWSELPTVEQFEEVAAAQGWTPLRLLDRLNLTIHRYPQIFDILKPDENQPDPDPLPYVRMLDGELRFLIDVLRKSNNTDYDLSGYLHEAVDSMHQMRFRLMKHRLQLGHPRVINRDIVDQMTRGWMGSCVALLLSILPASPTAPVPHPHLRLDLTRRDHRTGLDILTRATQLRLYSLLAPLILRNPSPLLGPALQMAVSNGDDLAVGIILKLQHDYSLPSPTPDDVVASFRSAQSIGYQHVANRLAVGICRNFPESSNIQTSELYEEALKELAPCDAWSNDNMPIFNDYMPVILDEEGDNETGEKGKKKSFLSKLIPSSSSKGKNVKHSKDSVGARCRVDRVHLSDLTLEDFHKNYVQRNQPVLIDLLPQHINAAISTVGKESRSQPLENADYSHINSAAQAFKKDSLLRDHGDAQILAGPIPYASLFGQQEKWWKLRQYLDYAENFTFQVRSNVVQTLSESLSAKKPSDVDVGYLATQFERNLTLLSTLYNFSAEIPLYLFSNEQMEINQLLKKDVFAVLDQPHPYPSGVKQLISLLQAVASADTTSLTTKEDLQTFVQLYLGPVLTGAPMHSHGPALNVLLSGAKLWAITPPGRELYTNIHPWEWIAKDIVHTQENPFFNSSAVNESLESEQAHEPCRIIQQAGQALFAPRHWSHQVLNLDHAIGFAVEVRNYVY
eukprot:gene9834-10877_t